MSFLDRQLTRAHSLLAQSVPIVRGMRRIRNQANAVIGRFCSEIAGPATYENHDRYNEFALIDRIAPFAENFIDVGANEGWWAMHFAQKMKNATGLAVDPNADTHPVLAKTLAPYPGVRILTAALSDREGVATFRQNRTASRRSSLYDWDDLTARHDDILVRSVPLTTLDRVFEQTGWQRVTFIKIDAEGEDYFILRGMREILSKALVDIIQFEYGDWRGITLAAAINFLQDFGYHVYLLHSQGVRAVDVKYFGDGGSGNWVAFRLNSLPIEIPIIS